MVIFFILASGFLYYLLQKLFARYWNKNLGINLKFQEEYVYEGEASSLKETIQNAKRLPLPVLQVSFQISRDLEFIDSENTKVSDLCYKRDIFSVLFYQKITRTLVFTCKKRGFYKIDKADIRANNLFHAGQLYDQKPQNTSFYVYPRHVNDERLEIPFQKIIGTMVNSRFLYEDPFEFRGIREYQPTDPINGVNWAATARTGDIMVNVHDSTTSQEVVILLDVEDETVWKYPGLHEFGISIASSLADRLLRHGVPVCIRCNGRDQITGEIVEVPSGAGTLQINSIQECLSRIDLNQTAAFFEEYLDRENLRDYKQYPFYIMISKNQRENLQVRFHKLLDKALGGMWMIPLHSDMELKLHNRDGLEIVRWEVEK